MLIRILSIIPRRPIRDKGKRLKVFHLISGGDAGGAKTHVLSLLRELNRTAGTPLLTLGDGPLAREALETGLPCRVLRGGFAACLLQLRRIIAAEAPDLLHCHGARANLTGAMLKGLCSLPVISTIHSDWRLDYMGRPAARVSYGTLNAAALKKLDALVCVSDAMAGRVRARGFDRVFSIYNGADFDLPRSAPAFPGDPGAVTVAAAARFDPVKDLSTLLRGFAAAAERDPRLRLLLAGTGAEGSRLRALARESGCGERILFPGWVEDMEGFWASADVAVISSLSETFPYTLTMAARYGIPAVSTPVGGVPALIKDGVSGLLFPVGDAGALADALTALAADPALRGRLGAELARRGESEFSLAAMGRRQWAIYKAVLAGKDSISAL